MRPLPQYKRQHPKNYGWYQSRWHYPAGRIYDAAGYTVARKSGDALRSQKEDINDEQLPELLEQSVHKTVADMIRNWDKETVH